MRTLEVPVLGDSGHRASRMARRRPRPRGRTPMAMTATVITQRWSNESPLARELTLEVSHRLRRRLLLGQALAVAAPVTEHAITDDRLHREELGVVRPFRRDNPVAWRRPKQRLSGVLKLGLGIGGQ